MSQQTNDSKTCATCANSNYKMTTEPCSTCIDLGDSKEAPHYNMWVEKPS